MTKKLIWRLKEQPSTESLRELVKDKILTYEEAREILFSSEEITERDKKSLEDEIRFLRELVEKLSKDRTQIVEIIKEVKVPYYQYPWYQPYTAWCSTANTITGTENALNCIATSLGGAQTYSTNSSFSSIQTF